MIDAEAAQAAVHAWIERGQIRRIDGHILWDGKWKSGQPEAKFQGKRRGILPVLFAARHGREPHAGAKIVRQCGHQLCVSIDHHRELGSAAIIRGARTKSVRTAARGTHAVTVEAADTLHRARMIRTAHTEGEDPESTSESRIADGLRKRTRKVRTIKSLHGNRRIRGRV